MTRTEATVAAELEHLLRLLIADPLKLEDLNPDTERALLAALRAAFGSGGESVPDVSAPVAVKTPAWSSEDLMTVDEAAAVLNLSPRWLYRHAKTLPFSRKLSRKVLRFSRAGVARWLVTKRP